MCTTNELISKIEELKQLERLIKEAEKEVESLKNEIKEEMQLRNTEEMEVGIYIVRNTSVLSNRFDSTTFKKAMPEVYKMYVKQTASRKFTISC
jgi:predicted phage-related endonuclease